MVIAVRVDLDEYSIKFYIDDKQQGETMNLKKDKIYYPTIAYNSNQHGDVADPDDSPQYQLILCD